jgi:hypothetical protein
MGEKWGEGRESGFRTPLYIPGPSSAKKPICPDSKLLQNPKSRYVVILSKAKNPLLNKF